MAGRPTAALLPVLVLLALFCVRCGSLDILSSKLSACGENGCGPDHSNEDVDVFGDFDDDEHTNSAPDRQHSRVVDEDDDEDADADADDIDGDGDGDGDGRYDDSEENDEEYDVPYVLLPEEPCEDDEDNCPRWGREGECERNPSFMHESCRLTCQICEPELEHTTCVNQDHRCDEWAAEGECKANPKYMLEECRKACKVCSSKRLGPDSIRRGLDIGMPQLMYPPDGTVSQDIEYIIMKAQNYITMVVPEKFGEDMKDTCKNRDERCSWWALRGECNANPNFMQKTCAPACNTCEALTVEGRCPIDPHLKGVWGPGDLEAMFVRLTSEPYLSRYNVKVLSSPDTTDGPWVITMDNVLSEAEAERFIELGGDEGYERSADVGTKLADGTYSSKVNDRRTSENAWCYGDCSSDDMAKGVIDRLSNLTGIPEPNSEHLQLLRYEEGQFYKVHHDYIWYQQFRQCGPRVLTVYLYLNDVEAGGGTNFDKLDLTVMPKRGRALLWPSVLNDDPTKKDDRTTHQALPVEAGVKYGANAWFHLHDFKTPNDIGCA